MSLPAKVSPRCARMLGFFLDTIWTVQGVLVHSCLARSPVGAGGVNVLPGLLSEPLRVVGRKGSWKSKTCCQGVQGRLRRRILR